jgi:uncharacterized protein (TIGR03435 family)
MRPFACISLVGLWSSLAFGQAAGTAPAFDLANVHVSPKTTNPNMSGGVVRAGRYELRKASMVDLIRSAYSVEPEKVLGGPSWLETDRFDVIAKVPPSTSLEAAKLMLQTLLADRFKLVVHTDSLSPFLCCRWGKASTS